MTEDLETSQEDFRLFQRSRMRRDCFGFEGIMVIISVQSRLCPKVANNFVFLKPETDNILATTYVVKSILLQILYVFEKPMQASHLFYL